MDSSLSSAQVNARAKNAIIGSFVADAATMGLHWIYDDAKLTGLVGKRSPEFFEPPSSPFYQYESGSLSPYGDEISTLLRSLAEHPQFDRETFAQESFRDAVTYKGRLNSVLKEFVTTMQKDGVDASKDTGSASNTQGHGMVKAPLVAARYAGSPAKNVVAVAKEAALVHQSLEEPVEISAVAARVIELVILGRTPAEAVEESLEDCQLSQYARAVFKDGLDFMEPDPISHFGKSCSLPGAFQGAVSLMRDATSYEEVMRKNILAGGDSCSRAIWIGAVMGAAYGVPETWKSKVSRMDEIERLADQLVENRNMDVAPLEAS
eukprot:CAMPEP_0181317490 /NCGR_PEP_ID=MMETSP1101-20121128/16497_1 /TAXON_ID=46948 /ORGANISM="Rhodomonas abbreviata, Strain Caron Lab Isolate" /LENGTH=320 /DNA_ID=CAMNT_0023424889 /DNA_START=201 /DNA_END=1163 /DNA_ORIENTATION=+